MKYRISLLSLTVIGVSYAQTPRAMQLPDILAWKRIGQPMVSSNGEWFAYKLNPNEGNSEVVIRSVKDGKETRFAIGELPRPDLSFTGPPPPVPRDLQISEDSKWAAFLVYPSQKEAKALVKQKKPVQSKLTLVELATGNKKEFDKIRKFAFSGEKASTLAMYRYASALTPPPAAAPPSSSGAPADDRPQGADLIIYGLKTEGELNIGNVSDFSFDKKGNWLAWLIDAQDKAGNGIQAMNLETGAILPLDSSKASYKGLTWTEKGDGLATLRGIEDKAWEDKLYTLVAFKNFTAKPEKVVFDPSKDKSFPAGMSISPNRNPYWMADLSSVAFGIRDLRPKKKGAAADRSEPDAKPDPAKEDDPTLPDMVIWHWKDTRMQPMQQVQENADRNFSYLSLYRPAEQKFIQIANEEVRTAS